MEEPDYSHRYGRLCGYLSLPKDAGHYGGGQKAVAGASGGCGPSVSDDSFAGYPGASWQVYERRRMADHADSHEGAVSGLC